MSSISRYLERSEKSKESIASNSEVNGGKGVNMLAWLLRLLLGEQQTMDTLNEILAALAQLQTDMNTLQADVDSLMTSSVPASALAPVLTQVQAMDLQVNALAAAVNPPAPTPTPAPVSEEEPAAE
jgi:hypothetical protein